MNTRNRAYFGSREKEMARELWRAEAQQGLPDGVSDDNLQIELNPNSGKVFFTNDDFQVVMLNGDKLEQFFYCSECGNEGFAEDVKDENGNCNQCGEADTIY